MSTPISGHELADLQPVPVPLSRLFECSSRDGHWCFHANGRRQILEIKAFPGAQTLALGSFSLPSSQELTILAGPFTNVTPCLQSR